MGSNPTPAAQGVEDAVVKPFRGIGKRAYRDSLTEAQEVWELRKIGYFKIGQRS